MEMQRTPKLGSLQTLTHIQYVLHKEEVQTSLGIKNVGRKILYDIFTSGNSEKEVGGDLKYRMDLSNVSDVNSEVLLW